MLGKGIDAIFKRTGVKNSENEKTIRFDGGKLRFNGNRMTIEMECESRQELKNVLTELILLTDRGYFDEFFDYESLRIKADDWSKKAYELQRKNYFNDAVNYYKKALFYGDSGKIRFNLALCYESLGKNNEATSQYLKAIKVKDAVPIRFNLARLLYKQKSYADAMEHISEAAKQCPKLIEGDLQTIFQRRFSPMPFSSDVDYQNGRRPGDMKTDEA